jgi:RimJ/RimL family protein N-acetyltransferase
METLPVVILESERLIFRRHIASDKEPFCAMEMDAEVRCYVGGYPHSREDAERRFSNVLNGPAGDMNMWATVLKSDETYIGRCGLYQHILSGGDMEQGVGVLAYYIAKAYWNKGYASEAGSAFVQFGFNVLGVNKIVATIEVGNSASIHIAKKLGFYIEATEFGEKRSFAHLRLDRK